MNRKEVLEEMKETEEIMGMIKEEGAAYFARERGNKVEVGLYLEHIIEERGMKKKDIVRKLNLEESYARKLFAAIIYGLEEKITLEEMNSFLDEIGEEILL